MREKEIVWSQKHMRMSAFDAIDAEMRIRAVGSRQVRTNSRKVLLMDLSPECLRFKTTLWLPPDEEWTVTLKFTMEGIPLETAGMITQASGGEQWWTYAVELDRNPVKRAILARVLGQLLKTRAPVLYRIHETYRKQLW